MSSAFVYSILAVLLIALDFTMAVHSNIHEKMTRSERLAVFGSEDSVPDYKVISISLPGARRRPETDAALEFVMDFDGYEQKITLTPTAGYLVTNYTPVWSARSDRHAYQKIRYDPLSWAMSSIGEFKMYHDAANDAALTTYTDPTEGIIMEGIILPYYAIRSLPLRLIGETLTEGKGVIGLYNPKKRSLNFDAEENTRHVVVFQSQGAPYHVKPRALVDPDNLPKEKRAETSKRGTDEKRRVPEAVYPEILVVIDYNAIRNQTIARALRFVLAFWNGVDMVYSRLTRPKVHLNIAGIIIARDDRATPYIASDTSAKNLVGTDDQIVSRIRRYFSKETVRFPVSKYDMIIAMTTMNACYKMEDRFNPRFTVCTLPFRGDSNTICLKTIRGNGIIGYDWEFSGIYATAETVAQIFGAEEGFRIGDQCAGPEDSVINLVYDDETTTFMGPKCDQTFFPQFFSSTKSKCLDNKPRWRKAVRKILPGRWMSMDGQCRNEGFVKACKLKTTSMCVAKGCQAKGSSKCIRTRRVPLPGTECARNKHCSTKKKCVGDL